MGWKKLISFILIIISMNSCCIPLLQKKYYTTEYGSHRPIKSKFKTTRNRTKSILEESLTKNIYFRTDSIYITKVKDKKKELKIVNTFKRFFSDGQYIEGTTKNIRNGLEDFNNLKSGIIGYYKTQNDKILYEYFLVTAHNCGDYYRAESNIIGDSIAGYKKIKVEGLKGTPDW
ncbi:hypothetical protein [Aquimarina sediminis]|uniref:hypothetical protein n=1 Tax=Aquimarina sediminis TaxID=2070536 RepID=UPI000CA08FD2|nr:hypothetical protein [Aquimarina sediminis]